MSNMRFTYPVYPDLTKPKGPLSQDKRSQACWYFYTLAQKQKELVGDSLEDQQFRLYEGELWMDKHYEQTAQTVALIYGLESPDEFARAWNEVEACALMLGYPRPSPEYTRLVPRVIIQ